MNFRASTIRNTKGQNYVKSEHDYQRDTHFQGFAELLMKDLSQHTKENWSLMQADYIKFIRQQKRIIAQRAYDLVRCAAISISIAQMTQGDVTLHPNAMLRAVPDLTDWEWPLTQEFTQTDVWKEEKILATDLSECPPMEERQL